MLTPLLLALAASPQAHDHGVVALPTAARAQVGPVTAGELRGEGFVKGVPVAAPGGGAVWIVAQDGVRDVAVARAANLLRFFLTPVEGARFGSAEAKAAVADAMVANEAMLMMPEGHHRPGREPHIPAQPLFEDETPILGSRWYLEYDREHRDAALEEIFHLVHDTGIGTYLPGALPEYQAELDREARAAMTDGRWGLPIDPGVADWLEELEQEGSLAQEYIAAAIESYYGLWGGFDEAPGAMWGIYAAKTRAEMAAKDAAGLALVEAFLPPDLAGYEALVDPDFEGTLDLRFDVDRAYSHHARYLVEVTLTGAKGSGLLGNERDNLLRGNAGDNLLDGGAGVDRVRMTGARAEYEVRREGEDLLLADRVEGRDGTDRLRSVERVVFADGEVAAAELAAPVVHSMCDISQEFSFYMDGRFARQYLAGAGQDVRNWGTLHEADLSRTNLLVLGGGVHQIPYAPASIDHVVAYVRAGGGLVVMADGVEASEERPVPVPVAPLVERLGARLGLERAAGAAVGVGPLDGAAIEYRGGRGLVLEDPWQVLVTDGEGRPLLARRELGAGHVLLGSRGLFGSRPDASDPINAAWVTPLLQRAVAGKVVDPALGQRGPWAELKEQLGPLTLEYTEGTAPFARAIAEEYELVRPHLVALTGVEPAPGMIKTLLVLPTGGGGFSSGQRIAIGAFWGSYPERRYPMVELIAHEAGHSWVLPHPEPLWNEPIATYLGIRVGQRLGMPEADATLERALARARRHDAELDTIDPLAEGAPRDLVWGKSYFVFEELERLHGPGALAMYFRKKRELVPAGHPRYTFDDCVAVWSAGVGEDLFPWFRGLGFDVDRERATVAQD